MNVNKAFILGNVTRDPEIRNTPAGQAVASFGVATNRFWKDKESGERKQQVEFHNVVAWRRLAEIAQQYLKKGSLVYVEGRLQTRDWEDQQGVKKYRTEIVAERIQLGPKGVTQSSGDQPAQESTQKNVPPPEEEINIEEIPF